MDEQMERRVADERHRIDVSERLTRLEVSQKLYHDEIKSICERLHAEVTKSNADLEMVKSTLYGGPKDKVGLLGKMAILTSVGLIVAGVLLHPFERIYDKWFGSKVEPTEMVPESTGKRLQLYNRKTGEYEYFIEYPPTGRKK